ncbi:MAG: glucose-6-phosphate dehydrogenase assembly protein OpcA, partial [Actinomycetota bacterium]|nr:glucose-6-phosphate dehydrogenase assembly protein OpcA [Actinomycetota bacterium]
MIELNDTSSSAIAAEMVAERARHGSPAMGMVMTMVVVVGEGEATQALADARHASHEHPARVLGVILGDGRGKPTVNAQIGIGDGWGGEAALIRLSGEVVRHAESVVLPLLLPDSPVVVWWPNDHPDDPANDPIGALAQRRITDAASVRRGKKTALLRLCAAYAPGTTDLAWT